MGDDEKIHSLLHDVSFKLGALTGSVEGVRKTCDDLAKHQSAQWKKEDAQDKKIRELEDARLVDRTRNGIIAVIASFVMGIVAKFTGRLF